MGFELRLSSLYKLLHHYGVGTICAAIYTTTPLGYNPDSGAIADSFTVTCPDDTWGRYIYIQLPGLRRTLYVREIKAKVDGNPRPAAVGLARVDPSV